MDTLAKRLKHAREKANLSQAALAKRIGSGQSTIGSIENGRNQGSGKLLQIARALNVLPEWLETGRGPVQPQKEAGYDSNRDDETEYIGPAPKPALLPVAGIAQLGTNGWYSEVVANGSEGYVEHHTRDPSAYVLQVKGDSMHPAIRNGWYVIVEPSMGLSGGMYVAVALKDGLKMVKELLYETPTEYVLESVNGGERLTVPRENVETIAGVAAVVTPGKHRE